MYLDGKWIYNPFSVFGTPATTFDHYYGQKLKSIKKLARSPCPKNALANFFLGFSVLCIYTLSRLLSAQCNGSRHTEQGMHSSKNMKIR
jgi:hypothetical protein